ncbi:MAG: gamma-glutamyltransferase [Rhodobacteraceae bacterium]|nr:gamma-glutamyltransferase [Paracoccaceae bacterium]
MRIQWLIAALLAANGAFAQQAADRVAPEAATATDFVDLSATIAASMAAKAQGLPVQSSNWMIAVANPLAAVAGADILRAGGTAADAMVAVQSVLGLVEPQSSGLGGGRFWSGMMPALNN